MNRANMYRSRKALLVALALALGAVELTPQPAQAHGGSAVAGIVVGAVVGSIIAGSIIRHKHRRYRYY